MSMNGQADGPPTKMPVALIDILAAHQMKEGILAALYRRTKSGKGGVVEVNLYQSAVSSLANQAANYLMVDHVPQRIGSAHPNIAPYGDLFETADGKFLLLAVGTEKQFDALCEALRLVKIPVFATNASRVQNRLLLIEELARIIGKVPSNEILSLLQEAEVPVALVRNMEEVFETSLAKDLIRTEVIEGPKTKRVSTIAFNLK